MVFLHDQLSKIKNWNSYMVGTPIWFHKHEVIPTAMIYLVVGLFPMHTPGKKLRSLVETLLYISSAIVIFFGSWTIWYIAIQQQYNWWHDMWITCCNLKYYTISHNPKKKKRAKIKNIHQKSKVLSWSKMWECS